MALRSRVAMEVRKQRHIKLVYFLLVLVVIIVILGGVGIWYFSQPQFQVSKIEVKSPPWLWEELKLTDVTGNGLLLLPSTQRFLFDEEEAAMKVRARFPELATVTVSVVDDVVVVEASEREVKYIVCVQNVCQQADDDRGLFWSRSPVATSVLPMIHLATTTPWAPMLTAQIAMERRALEQLSLRLGASLIEPTMHVHEVYKTASSTWNFIMPTVVTKDYIIQAYEAATKQAAFEAALEEKNLLFLDIRIPSRIFFKTQ